MLRLRVAEYFDSVINEIDLYTETKIQSIKTQTEENWWNKRRREQIDEVRRIERACLDHVNTLQVADEEIEIKTAFVEYCFTVDYADLLYLAKANRYVEPKEKRFLDVHIMKGDKKLNLAINNHQSLDVIIEEFEVNLGDHFLSDAPVIDISSGLDKCCRIKRARISDTYVTQQNPIYFNIEDLSIQYFSLGFRIKNTGEEKEPVDVIKCLMTCRDHISMIIISLEYVDLEEPSQDMKAFVQSIKLDDSINQVKFYFFKKGSNFPQFDLSRQLENNNNIYFVFVINWQFISCISFNRVSLEDLESADLSSLHSLASLYLNMSLTGKGSSDWKFLDACRASLEHLYIRCAFRTNPLSLSYRTFRGMAKLKSFQLYGSFSVDTDSQEELFVDLAQLERLSIHSTTIPFVLSRKRLSGMTKLNSLDLSGSFSVDTDSQEELFSDSTRLEKLDIHCSSCTTPFQLSRKMFCSMTNLKELILRRPFSIEANNQEESFADLNHLKKLVINVDEHMLASKWSIHSPTVEELQLSFIESARVTSSQIRFKLPNLASLVLSFDCDSIDFDLADMMSCFSHVKKLKITSKCFDIMTKGWFNRLTRVEELVLDLQSRGHINSQLFEGFGHLTKLKICRENISLDRFAFHKLIHLESIALYLYRRNEPLDRYDNSMFDGLNSLRKIEHIYCDPRSRSYVYFKNLDRFILVVT